MLGFPAREAGLMMVGLGWVGLDVRYLSEAGGWVTSKNVGSVVGDEEDRPVYRVRLCDALMIGCSRARQTATRNT